MDLNLPSHAGVALVGLKTGLIMPTDDIVAITVDTVRGTVEDGDIVCVTEAVVARSQNRYVTCDELAEDLRAKLNVREDATIAVISPIVSRNRFQLVLSAIARAVRKGKVIVQLNIPYDEVGNQVMTEDFATGRIRLKKVLRSLFEARGNTPQMNVLIREIIAALKFQEMGYSITAIRKITGKGVPDITLTASDGRTVAVEVTFENLAATAQKVARIAAEISADGALAVAVDLQAKEITIVDAAGYLSGMAEPKVVSYAAEMPLYEATDVITLAEIGDRQFPHPITGIDYSRMYAKAVEAEGAKCEMLYTANPLSVFNFGHIDGIVVGAVHERDSLRALFQSFGTRTPLLTIKDVGPGPWGVIGSNVSDLTKGILKLLPDNADAVCDTIVKAVAQATGKKIEVLIFGDGAFKDPDTGIYELADPYPAIGSSDGLRKAALRQGNKLKMLVETYYRQGMTREQIADTISRKTAGQDELGTTPRRITGILATMADLAAGSADAGTPIVLIRNFAFSN